ncbi:MAG: DnaA/Hda family protein [Pseudomonadota bacterium]
MSALPRHQLILPFPERASYARDDFVASACNREAFGFVEAWRAWPGGAFAISGAPGAGKSHLGAIWADMTGAERFFGADLCGDSWRRLSEARALFLDEADRAEATALFHLMNALKAADRPLLLAAENPPRGWDVALPDLKSRLNAMPSAHIAPPDDALLRAILEKLLKDKGLIVREAVLDYAVARMERSFQGARALAADLAAAADQREKVTTGLVGRLIRDAPSP